MSHMMHAVLIVLLIELNLPALLSLTVEPSLMQTISNTDNYAFGYHTAIYDKTILVNGEGQSETINIYELNETSMEWQNTFNIYNTSIYSGSGKLYKSAIYNNTALISVSGYYDSGNRVGSIFIYEKEYPNTFGSSWKFIDKAIGIDCCPSWVFGWSVSLCEYYFIVGSPDARKAYIYSKNRASNTWDVDNYVTLTAIYGGSGYFGYDVDITCNENVATAIITQSGSNANYIFEKYYYNDSYETDWEVTGYFDESSTQSGESMRSVSLYNNSIAVVGSKFDNSYKGCVFIYYKNETDNNNYEWIKLTKLTYSGSASYDYFGTLVDIYNDILLVGDYNDNVYLYQQSANNISQWNFISIMSNWDSNEYDFSISLFDEYAVIGQKDSRTIKIYSQMDLQTSNPTLMPSINPSIMTSSTSASNASDDDSSDSETNVNDDNYNSLISSLISNIVIIIAIICVTIVLLVAICVTCVYKERKQVRKLNMEKELHLQTSRMTQ